MERPVIFYLFIYLFFLLPGDRVEMATAPSAGTEAIAPTHEVAAAPAAPAVESKAISQGALIHFSQLGVLFSQSRVKLFTSEQLSAE